MESVALPHFSLHPTYGSFKENVARAHLQVSIWRKALEPNPPAIDPLTHGWTRLRGSTSLTPTSVAEGISLVPVDILKMIKCSCDSNVPCKSKRCGCHNANMACTEFCGCGGGEACFNQKTRELSEAENADSANEDNDNPDDI